MTLDFGDGPFALPIDADGLALLGQLNDEFFDRLEIKCKRSFCHAARQEMRGWLTAYVAMVKGYHKPSSEVKQGDSIKRKIAADSRWLANALEAGVSAECASLHDLTASLPAHLKEHPHVEALCQGMILFSRFQDLVPKLRELAVSMCTPLPRPVGNRYRREDDQLIEQLARIFHRMGGRPSVSPEGPFGQLLRAVNAVLPRDVRNASGGNLLRRAKRITGQLQSNVRGLPRNLISTVKRVKRPIR